MPDQGRAEWREYDLKRYDGSLKLAVVVLLVLSVASCKPELRLDPQKSFDRAYSDFVHGDMERSRSEADSAYHYFSGKNQEWAWKFRLLEANVLIWQGLSQPALALLNADLPAALLGGDLAIQKQMLEGLAYIRLGHMLDADRRLSEAERLCSSTNSIWTGEVAGVRGVYEVARDNLSDAQDHFRRSLNLARARGDHFLEATALLNLSRVALGEEHFDESIDWSTASYQAAESISSKQILEKSSGNRAWAYYKMGDFDRSLALYVEASKQAHDIKMTFDEIRWLNNAGLIYYEKKQFSLAQDNYQKALELAEAIENQEQITNGLIFLSFVAVQTGHPEVATQNIDRALELARKQEDRQAELYTSFVKGQILAQAKSSDQAELTFKQVALQANDDASLRWQAQNLLARLYEAAQKPELADRQYNAALDTLECARSAIGHEELRLPFLANAAHVYDDYIHFLVEQRQIEKALRLADYSRAQTLAEGLGLLRKNQNCASRLLSNVSPQVAAQKSGGTILFYWLGQRESYLWVITTKRTSLYKLPAADGIASAVQAYRKSLLGSTDVLQTGDRDGVALYKMLVAPAEGFIPRGSRVVIIPDQSLNNLNFETLLTPGDKLHYWIEDVTISCASSLRVLAARSAAKSANSRKLLLIGDPVVPDPKYPQLTEAANELKEIQTEFSAAATQTFVGKAATPMAYLNSKPEQYSYIHFVAHGIASQSSPLDSAIVLSKATSEEDSFKLHARDIIRHPLRADLVTISACYGSGSTVYNGEGLVGLSWGFIRAGAHNVIGALWAVSDKSTSQLMAQVYSELQKGRPPENALRDAKLSLLHSDSVYRKPVYWGPFQFYVGS
jgi:CHAT domain-containing protein